MISKLYHYGLLVGPSNIILSSDDPKIWRFYSIFILNLRIFSLKIHIGDTSLKIQFHTWIQNFEYQITNFWFQISKYPTFLIVEYPHIISPFGYPIFIRIKLYSKKSFLLNSNVRYWIFRISERNLSTYSY